MLEYLLLRGKRLHLRLFIYGILLTVVAIFLSNNFIGFYDSLMAVILISLAAAYPMIRFMQKEEMSEERIIRKVSEENLLKRHFHEISIYLVFFSSVFIGFIIMSYFTPFSFFEPQTATIDNILVGNFLNESFFSVVFENNMKVFLVTFLTSFFIAGGMIFILVWNASVFGVFLHKSANSLLHLPLFTLGFIPHGILEISAYIVAGLSGALLSHEMKHIKDKKYRSNIFPHILRDVVVLFLVGVGLIFFGAVVEAL